MNNRNLGFFKLTSSLVEGHPEEVARLFSLLKIVPVKVKYLYDEGCYEYLAIGERFKCVARGCEAPEYRLMVTKNFDGEIESVKVDVIT